MSEVFVRVFLCGSFLPQFCEIRHEFGGSSPLLSGDVSLSGVPIEVAARVSLIVPLSLVAFTFRQSHSPTVFVCPLSFP